MDSRYSWRLGGRWRWHSKTHVNEDKQSVDYASKGVTGPSLRSTEHERLKNAHVHITTLVLLPLTLCITLLNRSSKQNSKLISNNVMSF